MCVHQSFITNEMYCISFLTEERNDVLNLVESDDEIFTEAVPRLPVLPNGHSTTLVEIHRIPSSKSRPPEVTWYPINN